MASWRADSKCPPRGSYPKSSASRVSRSSRHMKSCCRKATSSRAEAPAPTFRVRFPRSSRCASRARRARTRRARPLDRYRSEAASIPPSTVRRGSSARARSASDNLRSITFPCTSGRVSSRVTGARSARSPCNTETRPADKICARRSRATCAAREPCAANPEQILIVSGSQQALAIAALALLDPGDRVWPEDPGSWLAQRVFTLAGVKIVPVPIDGDGLDVAAGIKLFRRARLAFVTPSHQFPLGSTMSLSRRLKLLEWAQSVGSWIIEDDYDAEYRYESRPISSLQGLDGDNRVIYVGTCSKVLFPALRLGYMVVPPDLIDRFISVRQSVDVAPPDLHQAVLAEFIEAGHFARHIRRMRTLYGERRALLEENIRKVF